MRLTERYAAESMEPDRDAAIADPLDACDELRSHGMTRNDVDEIFMAMRLAGDAWPDGPTALLGHLF
ncbi:MAG: hypothetical protein F4145_19490 [Boseongicola sp. SB0675_bin_26]|nr:hypothetical protein [Boseongicola sp. SB0675_bin_26]